MASMIDTYVAEIETVFKAIADSKDEAKIESKLADLEEMLEQMKIEVHSVTDKSKKTALQARIREWEEEMTKQRRALLTGGASAGAGAGGPGGAGLLTEKERGGESLAHLEAARKTLIETEEVAKDTIGHLATQKETIKRATENTRAINSNLSLSNKLLGRMGKWWRG